MRPRANISTLSRPCERSGTVFAVLSSLRERLMRITVNGLIPCFLALSLTSIMGCTKAPRPVVVETLNVPKALLNDCVIPESHLAYDSTNGDYEEWVDDVYTALVECAASKKLIREYLAAVSEEGVDKEPNSR